MSTLAFPPAPVQCADFAPERMLYDDELRQASRLIRQLRAAHDTPRETLATPRPERLVKRIAALTNDLTELAEVAWAREFGVQQFAVLCIRPSFLSEDRCFMVESVCLDQWATRGPLHWVFNGSKLRKDGLVGTLSAHVTFRHAAIARRHLSGQWEALPFVMEKAA